MKTGCEAAKVAAVDLSYLVHQASGDACWSDCIAGFTKDLFLSLRRNNIGFATAIRLRMMALARAPFYPGETQSIS